MFEIVLYSVIAISVLSLAAIAHKYHIDTSSTIAELSKDRKLYQRMAWQEIEAREKFLKSNAAAISDLSAKVDNSIQELLKINDTIKKSGLEKKEKSEISSRIELSVKALSVFSTASNSGLPSPIVEKRF